MGHPAGDHVHRLIRSMSRAEKRHFKLYTSRHLLAGHSTLQALFDAIAALPAYDAAALHKRFEGEAFMRRFAITKRRLYEAVLDSLDAFHAAATVDDRLRRMLHQVEILFAKALYADAAKLLRAAAALARKHERHPLVLQAAEWERRLMERANYAGITAPMLAERAQAAEAITAAWGEADRLWAIKSHVFLLLYRSGQAPGPKEYDRLSETEAQPLLAEGRPLHGTYARFLHHHVRAALAYARNDLQACEAQLEAGARVLRQSGEILPDASSMLLGVMGNLAHIRMRIGKHQEALDGFKEFRRLPLMMAHAPNPDLEVKLFVLGTSLEFSVLAARGNFGAAAERVAALEEGLDRHGGKVGTVRRVELMLQAAYVLFGTGQFGQALRWCNHLLSEKGIEAHTELHALGRMLNLMLLVELDRKEHLGYVARNTQRYLERHGHALRTEQLLLNFATKASKGGQVQHADRALLAEQLGELAKQGLEPSLLDQVDLLAWAQAKCEGRPFATLVQEKWRARRELPKPSGRKTKRAA